MENVNRLLLENVLPAHVAAHFIGDKLNEVQEKARLPLGVGETEATDAGCPAEWFSATERFPWVSASPAPRECVVSHGGDRLWSHTPG